MHNLKNDFKEQVAMCSDLALRKMECDLAVQQRESSRRLDMVRKEIKRRKKRQLRYE